MATTDATKHIISEIPTYITVYSDDTVDRPRQAPTVPPNPDHPNSPSKDIIISQNPNISARIYLPKISHSETQKLPILVFFHGGGFFFESAFSKIHHEHCNVFVPLANSIVVSVEYRLAPEHPLPACYNDCWNSLQWVASNSAKNPVNAEPWLINHGDFNRVFIGGPSSGGNIVHNIAMRAGSEALPNDVKLLGAILQQPLFFSSYPVGLESVKLKSSDKDLYSSLWSFVYPSAHGGIDNPMINPVGIGATSLDGLGCDRMIVCVAGKDGLRDRGVWYYELVKKSGWKGKLELFEEEDEDHVYHIFHPESESGQKLIKHLASFLHELNGVIYLTFPLKMRRRRVDAKIGEAVSFVMEVKHVFQDRREKYDEFLKILDDFSAERIDRAAVKEGMTELLKDHKGLISRFNIFLPPGQEISLPLDDDEQQGDGLAFEDEPKHEISLPFDDQQQ